MTYIPSDAAAVLPAETPKAGGTGKIDAAAAYAQEVVEDAGQYQASLRGAQRELLGMTSKGAKKVDAKLGDRLIPGAQTLQQSASSAKTAFNSYAAEVSRINGDADRVISRINDALGSIRTQAAAIAEISQSIRWYSSYAWDVGAPGAMPEPSLDTRSKGMTADEETAAVQTLRSVYEQQWFAASVAWHTAIDSVNAAKLTWSALISDRKEAERQLVQALNETDIGQLISISGGGGGGKGPMVGAALVSEKKVFAESVATRRSHLLLDKLYGDKLDRLLRGDFHGPDPDEVAKWWAGLSDVDRKKLLTEVPLVIGNLDGVPFEVRIQANATTAAEFAKKPGITKSELSYWNAVADGTRKLVVSDPENSRIVEMIGVLGPETRNIVTFLPGTSANMKGFYKREAQAVSKYLFDKGKGTTVAFVYKDGPWATWAGARANSSRSAVERLGERVAGFQDDVLAREQFVGGAKKHLVSHSAGVSVGSAAEVAGAKFDTVVSLGGAWLDEDWTPNDSTNYHHFQYDQDAIDYIDDLPFYDTPRTEGDVFAKHVFDGKRRGGADGHGRIAQGPETNKDPLDGIAQLLK